jgi:acetylornithine deacetylase/succinyl-diaminopimelate desuccinylase-like protein
MSVPQGSPVDQNLSDVFAYIEEHRDEYVQRLMEYVSRPSISAQGIGIAETSEFLAKLLDGLGMQPRILPTSGWPMVLGQRSDMPDKPTLLLYGHYDVQPPEPLEEWITPPFEPAIRDGRIYGRGVGDNKGQHLAQILAIEALLACRGSLPCNVKLLLEGEEEIGSPRMPEFVEAHRDDLAADLVVTSDGGIDPSGRPTIVFGVRGVLSFELRARGANQDLHSGRFGGVAPNPIWTLVHLLATMKNPQGDITIDGFYDNVRPITDAERAAMDELPIDSGALMRELDLGHLDAPADRGIAERLMAWPTLTINGFLGGYTGKGSKTVLPHQAGVKCDIRMVENQTADEIFARVQAHVQNHAPNVELIRQGSMDPSRTALESRFAEPIRRAVMQAQGEAPLLVPSAGGSLPDYVFTKRLGIPSFVVPYANADEANHAPNENMEIERFIKGIRTGAALIAQIAAL